MSEAALASTSEISATYSVTVEPAFVRVLEKLTADGETSIEEMLAGWIETACVELNMGEEIPWSADDIEAIEEGIAQLQRGEWVSQEDLMARLKAKYGG